MFYDCKKDNDTSDYAEYSENYQVICQVVWETADLTFVCHQQILNINWVWWYYIAAFGNADDRHDDELGGFD